MIVLSKTYSERWQRKCTRSIAPLDSSKVMHSHPRFLVLALLFWGGISDTLYGYCFLDAFLRPAVSPLEPSRGFSGIIPTPYYLLLLLHPHPWDVISLMTQLCCVKSKSVIRTVTYLSAVAPPSLPPSLHDAIGLFYV